MYKAMNMYMCKAHMYVYLKSITNPYSTYVHTSIFIMQTHNISIMDMACNM